MKSKKIKYSSSRIGKILEPAIRSTIRDLIANKDLEVKLTKEDQEVITCSVMDAIEEELCS